MKHIFDLLDEKPFSELTSEELERIKQHCNLCFDCQQAFLTARICSELLHAKRMEQTQPSPFFHTRIISKLKQENAKVLQLPNLWWQTSVPVFVLIVLFIVSLLGLTIMLPSTEENEVSATEIVPTEMTISDKRQYLEITNDDILRTIYLNNKK
jgi:hypothetical protein